MVVTSPPTGGHGPRVKVIGQPDIISPFFGLYQSWIGGREVERAVDYKDERVSGRWRGVCSTTRPSLQGRVTNHYVWKWVSRRQVCYRQVLFQPRPGAGHLGTDFGYRSPCSDLGPSWLYQGYNR